MNTSLKEHISCRLTPLLTSVSRQKINKARKCYQSVSRDIPSNLLCMIITILTSQESVAWLSLKKSSSGAICLYSGGLWFVMVGTSILTSFLNNSLITIWPAGVRKTLQIKKMYNVILRKYELVPMADQFERGCREKKFSQLSRLI